MRRLARRSRIIAGLMLALALVAITCWLIAINWRPSMAQFPRQGAYVSESSGTIDWPALQSNGASFAYILASHGANRADVRFEQNWKGAFAIAMPRGAVHRYSLCQLARDQAARFSNTVPVGVDDLPAAVEIHFAPGCAARPERNVVLGEIRTFLRLAEAHTGKPMILKISPRVERFYRLSRAIRRPLWAEQSFFPPEYMSRAWKLWQASSIRQIDGAARRINWVVVAP